MLRIGTLQKASLAVLVWAVLYFSMVDVVYSIVWPPERRSAERFKGHYFIDVPPPLPAIAGVLIYALPTIAVGVLTCLYRRGSRRQRQLGPTTAL